MDKGNRYEVQQNVGGTWVTIFAVASLERAYELYRDYQALGYSMRIF